MSVKTCTKCRKSQNIDQFYKYTNRPGYRPDCKDCRNAWSRDYGKKSDVKRRRNLKKVTWNTKNLDSWKHHIPSCANCEVCNIQIYFDNKNINTSIHFDHRVDNCEISESPKNWLLKHRFSDKNKAIWDSCDFGILCGKCNRSLPTRNRKGWVERVVRYVLGEK